MEIELMDAKQLKELISAYQWDDEKTYEIPRRIMVNKNLELGLALDIFYRADGTRYFGYHSRGKRGEEVWMAFMDDLYERIASGTLKAGTIQYTVPLVKGKKYQYFKEDDVPEIFLDDVR